MIQAESRGLLDLKACWFVPFAELSNLDNVDKPDYGYLRKVDSELKDTDQFVEAGGSFTISLESFLIREAHDSNQKNDLLVRSFVRYGNEPKTATINFFGTGIAAGEFHGDLEYEHIFARRDFDESSRVWLALEILEIDRGLNKENSLTQAFKSMRGRFGAIFPALIPFAPVAGIALNTLGKLKALAQAAEQNQPILKHQIDWYAKAVHGGDAPLRYGAYILFNEGVQGVQYRLGSGFELKRRALRDKNTPVLHDYAVIKITPGIVEAGHDADELMKNQQIATVISELDNAEEDETRRTLHFSFLENVVSSASRFKDLQDYRKLMVKKDVKGALDENDEERLIALITRLGDLIPR